MQPGCMGLQCGVRLVRDVPGSGASSACNSSACSAPSLTPSMSVTSAISPRSRRASSTSPATWGCSLGAWGCSPCARGLQPLQRGVTAGRLSRHAVAQLRPAIHTHTRIHISIYPYIHAHTPQASRSSAMVCRVVGTSSLRSLSSAACTDHASRAGRGSSARMCAGEGPTVETHTYFLPSWKPNGCVMACSAPGHAQGGSTGWSTGW